MNILREQNGELFINIESIKATMAYEDMILNEDEIEICLKVINGELLADKVCEQIISNYKNPVDSVISNFPNIYCYPETDVLINKLNLKDFDLLKEVERKITSIRLAELKLNPIQSNLDINYFKMIHRHLFQDLYAWAGEFRNVRIAKGFMFAYPENLETQGVQIFQHLKKEDFLKDKTGTEFAKRLAYYKIELNVLHPFREGNGRVLREFIQILAGRNNYYLAFKEANKEEYMKAMVQSPLDEKPLEKIILESLILNRNIEL